MKTTPKLLSAAAAAALAMLLVPAAQAAGPDLRVVSVSEPPVVAAAGSSVKVRLSVANAGRASVRSTRTLVLLSRDARRSKGDLPVARVATRRIAAGRRTRVRSTIRIPATVGMGVWRVLACADGPKRVRETRERNNCRGARRAVTVPARPPTPAPAAPAPAPVLAPAPAPGCAKEDRPDTAFVDANCDGVDGVAADAVFVSAQTGSDGAPGTRAEPRRQLSDAVAFAKQTGRSSVLAATGSYPGTLKCLLESRSTAATTP